MSMATLSGNSGSLTATGHRLRQHPERVLPPFLASNAKPDERQDDDDDDQRPARDLAHTAPLLYHLHRSIDVRRYGSLARRYRREATAWPLKESPPTPGRCRFAA